MTLFSVEVPRDLQVKIVKRLGAHQFILNILFSRGDNVAVRIQEVFESRQIPACLYKSVLEHAVCAVREALSTFQAPAPPLPAQQHGQPSQSVGHLGVWLTDGLLEVEEQQWPRLLRCGSISRRPHKELRFWCAYDYLLRHCPAKFKTLGTLEMSYLKGVMELKVGRQASLDSLQMRQSLEMELVRRQAEKIGGDLQEGSGQDITALVTQHVGELEAVELHWQSEINELKVKQRADFHDLIIDFFEAEVEQMMEERSSGAEPQPAEPIANDDEDDDGFDFNPPPRSGGGVGAQDSSSGGESRPLIEGATIRIVFGQQRKVFFVVRLWVGDIMDLLDFSEEDMEAAMDEGDGAGPQLPPWFTGPRSYLHRYTYNSGYPLKDHSSRPIVRAGASLKSKVSGSGPKHPAYFHSSSIPFWPVPAKAEPVKLSTNAYGMKLAGLIIPTPEHSKFDTGSAHMLREFARRCEQLTDYHFPALPEQLQSVQASVGKEALKCGDYFCTRHSNLGGRVQAAFHIITNSSEATSEEQLPATIQRVLKRVVKVANDCSIAELSLPLLLLDLGPSESSLPYALAQKRAQNVLRCLKSALSQMADDLGPNDQPELKVINLVLPSSCSNSPAEGMVSIVESTLSFMRHSFQCV